MPLILPEGKSLAAALCADFDAVSLWMAKQLTSPSCLSRGEFGAEVGIYRVLDLFRRYQVRGTFCIPGHTLLTYPKQVETIARDGHEIAAHGAYHEKVSTLEPARERELMELQLEQHTKVLGRRPRGYRSPSWDFSDITLSLLEEFKFDWDSSLMGRDFEPYHPRPVILDYEKGNQFGPPSPILEFPVSWYLDEFPFVELYPPPGYPGATTAPMLLDRWTVIFDYALANAANGVYILTVHPQTIGRAQFIVMFEELIQHMNTKEGVWFASLSDIFECWHEDSQSDA
jgi:peptidoglycan/xylan/chitin deacetylase (PgdA/CDA1 family)